MEYDDDFISFLDEQVMWVRATPRSPDIAYLAAVDRRLEADRVPNAMFFQWAADWERDDHILLMEATEWRCAGICVARTPKEQLVALGEEGEVFVAGGGEAFEEQIPADTIFRGIQTIQGIPHAVGMERAVFRREDQGQWVDVRGALPVDGGPSRTGFEAIDGFDLDDIYAVGWGGEIWHCDRGAWRKIASPTNVILTDVRCAADGNVYACGQAGVILKGRGDHWQRIDSDKYRGLDLWSIEFVDNTLYVAGMRMLLRLELDDWVPATEIGPCNGTFGSLAATDGIMWSVGEADLHVCERHQWTRIR